MEQVKDEIRIIGIDDFPFEKNGKPGKVRLVGCVFRGKKSLDGVLTTKVEKDGRNATKKIIEMIKSSPHYEQLQVIMLDGIAMAGFNVVDIQELSKTTGLDCIVIIKKRPDLAATKKALKFNFKDSERRIKLIEKAGEIHELDNRGETTFYQKSSSLSNEKAEAIIRISTRRGAVPEPVRVAHLISHGIGVGS